MVVPGAMPYGSYIHYGDKYETANRELAGRLIKAISTATNLENREYYWIAQRAEMTIAATAQVN